MEEKANAFNEHLKNPKKAAVRLTCAILYSVLVGYFFGSFWWSNPDQFPSSYTE
jgi:hypothetical protein